MAHLKALVAAGVALVGAAAPPAFLQCDPSWAAVPMGTAGNGEDSTICGEGCAMTCLSMALNGLGAAVPVAGIAMPAMPLTLNSWLETHDGYTCADGDCNNLVLDAVARMNASWRLVGEVAPPPLASIEAGLDGGRTVYIAHVRNQSHFVLLTGYTAKGSGVFTVNDPMAYQPTYALADVHDIIIYTVNASATAAHGRAADQPVVPFADYPLYKQCDPAWAADPIGNETSVTICDVGCLMSSVSMALARNNITIPDAGGAPGSWRTANPQSLNGWLQLNAGYVDGDDFDEDDLPPLNPRHIGWNDTTGMHVRNDVPLPQVQALLRAGQPVIANVMGGHHFVLVIGWDAGDPDTLLVNDPGFDTASYSYAKDVVGWRLFNMTAAPAPGHA